MRYVRMLTKTYKDNTGRSIDLYSLLVEHNGETSLLHPLHEYQLKNHVMSKSWHNKLIQAVELMLDYMDANRHYFSSPKAFFESFAESMHSGTIGEDGYDPSGLYWLPKRTTTAYNLLYSITQFSDWLAENALLKHQTTLTIDMRDMRLQQRESLPSGSTEVLAAKVEGLLPTEINALEHAVSEEFLSHQGWIPDTQGRVKMKGMLLYKAGYVTAIKKILSST